MLGPVLAILIPVAASALVVALLAGPMVRREVAPNGLYGLRTPATLADPEVWYEANARSGRDLRRWAAVQLAATLGGALAAPVLGVGGYGALCAGVGLAGGLAVAVRGWRHANALLTARRRQGGG